MDGERDLLNVKYEAIVSEFAPKLVSHVEHCIPYHAIKIKTNPHEKGKGKNKTLLHTEERCKHDVLFWLVGTDLP